MRMTTIFHTRSLFLSFFSYEKGKLVLKFTTVDRVKPSILSFIVCGSVCCALLSTDQKPKWNYILSKTAIRSVLRKKTPKPSYIREYLHTCQHWIPLKRLKRFSKKNLQFCFVFCSRPRAEYSSRTFFNSESPLSCLWIFLINWSAHAQNILRDQAYGSVFSPWVPPVLTAP